MNRMHSYEQIKLTNSDMKKSTSLDFISNSVSHMEYLASILKCPLCAAQVKQAHMCPMCCKLFCELCIKNSIVYKKAECPCCAKPLRYTSPINCEALVKQIEDAINKTFTEIGSESVGPESPYNSKVLSGVFSTPQLVSQQSRISLTSTYSVSSGAVCPEHELKLQYYCETCQVGVCSDCAVLSNKHQGHKLCKFSQKRVKFQEKVTLLIKSLMHLKNEMVKKKQETVLKIENTRRSQREKKELLVEHLKKCSESALAKINALTGIKTEVGNKERENNLSLNQLLKKYENVLYTTKKVALVKRSNDYINEVKAILTKKLKPLPNFQDTLQNHFSPSFGSKTFILDNYTHLRQKGEILYSQPLFFKGIQWKLRIFPGGIDQNKMLADKDRFLAIYLQMSKGHRQPNIYKYEIILINQIDRTKAIGCTFENQFEEGTYWGLDKFANIGFLNAENFIHPLHGYLEIVLNVKSPTYYHAVRDQSYFISEKETTFSQNLRKLKSLRKKAGPRILKVNAEAKRSLTIRALTDKIQKAKSNRPRRNSLSSSAVIY